MPLKLEPIDIKKLKVVTNACNLRRDLHVFVNYCIERQVKRSHRHNDLSKGDFNRLNKLMSAPEEFNQEPQDSWIDYVDEFALKLGFVKYDTEGEYMGYTSMEPSFPNNYIQVKTQAYNNFLTRSLQQQEKQILDTMIKDYAACRNEFFNEPPLSQLARFDGFGCETGVLPFLDFSAIREFLFQLLIQCEVGTWYSTQSLIQYLKNNYPFFLITEKPKYKNNHKEGRYSNFAETYDRWKRSPINESDKDGFERVEGRYVERFLEHIPFTLNYVDVAYGKQQGNTKHSPSWGELQAFRITPLFAHVMAKKLAEPSLTVQPNFELQLQAEVYPAKALQTLTSFADILNEDTTITLKLQKQKVVATLAQSEPIDVIALLNHLSDKPLPQNVLTELEEWSGHSEAFTLYQGFGLLECDKTIPPVENKFHVETITPTLHIIKQPKALYKTLEKAEHVPLWIKHSNSTLTQLPPTAKTIFPKLSLKQKSKAKPKPQQVVINREVCVTLNFPSDELLGQFRNALLAEHCLLTIDTKKRSIRFPQSYEKHLKTLSKQLETTQQVVIKNSITTVK